VSTPLPADLRARLTALGCDPDRVRESFTHSGGAGGQNVNKVATCVQLVDPATGVRIKMQEHRTQAANRAAAWRLLAHTLRRRREEQVQERRDAREKVRRAKALRPGWLKARLRDLKRHRARRKGGRGAVGGED
jgi:protein subunit release factor B